MQPFLLKSCICVHFSPEEILETPTIVLRNLTDRLGKIRWRKTKQAHVFSCRSRGYRADPRHADTYLCIRLLRLSLKPVTNNCLLFLISIANFCFLKSVLRKGRKNLYGLTSLVFVSCINIKT